MKELTSYFPHDSNARNSDKLIRLRMRHKASGYGVFFMILERLREEPEYMSVKDYNMIAFDLREDASLIKSVIEDFGLFVFTEDGKYFYSESFKKRMGYKDDKSKKRSEAGKKGVAKRWGKKESEIANATEFIANATENDSNAIAKVEKTIASKGKKRKENNIGDSNESLVCGTSQPHAEHIDYSELVKFFNEETKGVFGSVRTPLSDSRKGMINARIKSYGKKTFADMIHRAYQSDFLKGQNKKGWTASFDWLIKPTNFEKVISGNYDNKNSRNYSAIPNGAKSREEQTDREILEYAAKAFGKDTVSSK